MSINYDKKKKLATEKPDKNFARRCLNQHMAGGYITEYTIITALNMLGVPPELSLKERLTYFALLESKETESKE